MKTLFLILTSVLFIFVSAKAATELQTSVNSATPVEKPKWKATAATHYYNFEGTRASNRAAYEFADSTLNIQLLTLQYEISPSWTLMILGQHLNSYVETKMFGETYKDRTQGLGDTIASFITPLYASSKYLVLGDVGFSLPTGSINLKNEYNTENNYAYNMQMGSGTVDAVMGLTALSFQGPVQIGGHLTGIFRNGRNSNGYALGNLYRLDSWVDYATSFGVTPRLVGYYKHKDAVQGYDDKYERSREVPAVGAFYEFYHHNQINWDISAAVKYSKSVGALSVAVEAGIPVAQGMQNNDNVAVSTQYFGNLSVTGVW